MASVLHALEKAEDRGELTLHYFDESGFSQRSALPYAWSPVGRPVRLPAFSHSRRLNVLGFYSRHEGVCTRTTTERITTEEVIAAFEDWMAHHPREKPAVVVLDNANIHRSARFQRQRQQWMAQHVYVLYLPPYSPELNRIEGLWRKIKYESLPLKAYQTFETLCDEVRAVLDRCTSSYQAICV
jgi:transposase